MSSAFSMVQVWLCCCCIVLLSPVLSQAQESVFRPQSAASVYTWTGASYPERFTYPEVSNTSFGIAEEQQRPDIGISLSGGGFRAASLAMGWVRALHQMGVLSQMRYMASTSGSSWFNAAYSWQTAVPVDAFLGPYIPPQNLTLDRLYGSTNLGAFGQVLSNNTIAADAIAGAVSDVLTDEAGIGGWSAAVAEAFLQPFGLGSHSSTVSTAQMADRIRSIYPALQVYAVNITGAAPKPYPIIQGSIINQGTAFGFYPFEFTPLYVGTPPAVTNTTPMLGNGFVEPIGFNSPPPQAPPQPRNASTGAGSATRVPPPDMLEVSVTPRFVVPLASMVGISSYFLALSDVVPDWAAITIQDLTGTAELEYWNQINFQGARLAFADGAGSDYTAITGPLRRRTSNIIAGIANSAAINATTTATYFAAQQPDVAGLFGAVPPSVRSSYISGVPPAVFNQKMQVFPQEGYTRLWNAVQSAVGAGQAPIHLDTYEVMENSYHAIVGGWKVTVLWVMNADILDWQNALPQQVQTLIQPRNSTSQQTSTDQSQQQQQQQQQQDGGFIEQAVGAVEDAVNTVTNAVQSAVQWVQNVLPGGDNNTLQDLQDFPYVQTSGRVYSPAVVQMLSQQATYEMLQAEPLIRQMLQQPVATPGPGGARAAAATPAPSSAAQQQDSAPQGGAPAPSSAAQQQASAPQGGSPPQTAAPAPVASAASTIRARVGLGGAALLPLLAACVPLIMQCWWRDGGLK